MLKEKKNAYNEKFFYLNVSSIKRQIRRTVKDIGKV